MEDSNFFLKTVGLESYISQEKNFCDPLSREDMDNLNYNSLPNSKTKNENDKNGKDNVCYQQEVVNVQADDFFSSLELQSSSKISSNMLGLNFSNKMLGGVVTRSRSFSSAAHESSKLTEKINSNVKVRRITRNKTKNTKEKLKKVQERGRKIKKKEKVKKAQSSKKSTSENKVVASSEVKKPNLEENILEKGFTAEKSKEDDDWMLFSNLNSKKEGEDKIFENKQMLGNDLQNSVRCTSELFSMNSILMNDAMSEGKDEVDKLLDVNDYDDSFLEEMDEFGYAPPRSHTGGKWKPGSLSIRTSPMFWQNQTWDSILDDRNQYEEGKSRSGTPVDSSTESPSERMNKFPAVPCSGGKWKPGALPSTHTGGKWKPGTPPATYTGGKWKPSDTPQRSKKPDQEMPSPDDLDQNWKNENQTRTGPPSTHTGGKWKPSSGLTQGCEKWRSETSLKSNGSSSKRVTEKWVSGLGKTSVNQSTLDVLANCQSTSGKCLKTAGGMIQYYCSPCNRRLSSKKMFKKHVQSELHFKRVLQENELEFDPRSLKLFHGLFTQSGYRERGLGKRVIQKPKIFSDTEMEITKKDRKDLNSLNLKKKKLSKRETRCEVCKVRVPNHQLGKHLVSYYHSRRIQLNDPAQQKLILDNIHAIVKQAPYQCGMCKFYCNTHALFKKHWALIVHKDAEQPGIRRFWCSLCSFECETSRSMELHLDSNSHREVILAVNKSIPIIIRHKAIIHCEICFKKFHFNRELISHKHISHKVANVSTSQKLECSFCKLKCKNMKSLQKHIIHTHKGELKVPYFCSTCNESFNTAEEARAHRNNLVHKYKKTLSAGLTDKKDMSRACCYCEETFEDLDKLKKHLYEKHTEYLPKCIKCGKVFALSQEVSRHVKNNECDFSKKNQQPLTFNCESCTFCTNSKADLLLHTAIHETKNKKNEKDEKDEEVAKIPCPLCSLSFNQTALCIHLRTHLKEITYECSVCSKTFVRKDRYTAHLKSKHFVKKDAVSLEEKPRNDVGETKTKVEMKEENKKDEIEEEEIQKPVENDAKEKKSEKKEVVKRQKCGDSKCKYVAKDLNDLANHRLIHLGPKLYQCPECPYTAKTNTVIKRHYLIHNDQRSFPCPHCPFKARLKCHLSRHLRLHSGAKPYKCPHCSYTCNILENLRKHVLFTKIHPGKKLYECKECNFDTNVSKEFKMHLFRNHKDCRSTEATAAAGIYNRAEDFVNVINPIQVKPKTPSKVPPKWLNSDYLKKKMNVITEHLPPIVSKSAIPDKKSKTISQKNPGNSVEDKRKILQMELQKLRKQIKPEEKKLPELYPSSSDKELKVSSKDESKMEANDYQNEQTLREENQSVVVNPSETNNRVVVLNIAPTAVSLPEEVSAKETRSNDGEVPKADAPLTYVLYENVLPAEEMGLYLLDNFPV